MVVPHHPCQEGDSGNTNGKRERRCAPADIVVQAVYPREHGYKNEGADSTQCRNAGRQIVTFAADAATAIQIDRTAGRRYTCNDADGASNNRGEHNDNGSGRTLEQAICAFHVWHLTPNFFGFLGIAVEQASSKQSRFGIGGYMAILHQLLSDSWTIETVLDLPKANIRISLHERS